MPLDPEDLVIIRKMIGDELEARLTPRTIIRWMIGDELEARLERNNSRIVEHIKETISYLEREGTMTINNIHNTTHNTVNNSGTMGDVTIQNTLNAINQQQGGAEIARVFAELFKALEESKEIKNEYERKALLEAAKDIAQQAEKPADERDTGKLQSAWKYLTEAISAGKGLVEIAAQWEKWSKSIGGFFKDSGSSLPL